MWVILYKIYYHIFIQYWKVVIYLAIIKQCAQCGKEIKVYPSKDSKYNFCNRDCYNKFHKKNTKNYKCEICGKIFTSNNSQNANKFCSRNCYNMAH